MPYTFKTALLIFVIMNLNISTHSSKKMYCSSEDTAAEKHFSLVVFMKNIDRHFFLTAQLSRHQIFSSSKIIIHLGYFSCMD